MYANIYLHLVQFDRLEFGIKTHVATGYIPVLVVWKFSLSLSFFLFFFFLCVCVDKTILILSFLLYVYLRLHMCVIFLIKKEGFLF